MMDGGMMAGMGAWVLLVVAVLLAVLVLAVLGSIRLVRRLRAGTSGARTPDAGIPAMEKAPDPAETLRRRYAAGEIDDDEYERRRAVLKL